MIRRLKNRYRINPSGTENPQSVNLYKFIRLILGNDITDRAITRRWKMDQKNFHEFKIGKYPVPRLERLIKMAQILGVNRHLLFQVASGTPAVQVFKLIKDNDVAGQLKLLSYRLDKTQQTMTDAEKRYRVLFNHAAHAILVADAATGNIIDCNKPAEKLFGYTRDKFIGLPQANLFPPERRAFYSKNFLRRIKNRENRVTDRLNICRADGQLIPVTLTSRVVESERQKFIHGVFQDINPAL